MNRLIVKILIHVEHRYPFLWRAIEGINGSIFQLLYGRKFARNIARSCEEFSINGIGARPLVPEDLPALEALLARQSPERVAYFHPHGFDSRSLRERFRTPCFLMMGVFKEREMAGYFFLRCFSTRKCFVGRLVDEPYEGQGIGRMMNSIMYDVGWRSGFRVLSTISKHNRRVLRAHAHNEALKVLRELANDYLLVEFVRRETSPAAGFPSSGSLVVKRVFDFSLSLLGLLLLLPLLAVIALLHKLIMPGAVFFRQQRIGQFGIPFTVLKFRTMVEGHGGSTVSVKGEKRITPFGAFLRKYKVDELPELLNVVKGEMSFVGPRPDVPGYADKLKGENRRILLFRPGITSPATLKYAREEELLASEPDPIGCNDRVIWPDKVKINLDYLNHRSFWSDMRVIMNTVTGRSWHPSV